MNSEEKRPLLNKVKEMTFRNYQNKENVEIIQSKLMNLEKKISFII